MSDDQIVVIIADLGQFTERDIIGLTLDIDANLREDTPRDTSWAASNWVPNIGGPAQDPPVLEKREQKFAAVTAAQARATQGQAGVLGYTLDQGEVYVSNGVHYIEVLNGGSSAKAPANFVESAIERAVNGRSSRE